MTSLQDSLRKYVMPHMYHSEQGEKDGFIERTFWTRRVRVWLMRAAIAVLSLTFLWYIISAPSGSASFAPRPTRPSRPDLSISEGSQVNGMAGLVEFQKPKQKVMGLVFAGRREFVSILDCYLQRNLVRNGGWLDGVLWIINPKRAEDDEYLWNLTNSVPEYTAYTTREEENGTVRNYSPRYKYCEPDTIYIKIDDDVVFFEDRTVAAMVKRLVENPQYFGVSANIVNNPILSWVHYHKETYLPFFPEVTPAVDFSRDDAKYRDSLSDWRTSDLPLWKGPKRFQFTGLEAAPFKNHRWLPLPPNFPLEKTPAGALGAEGAAEYNAANIGMRSWAIAAQGHYSFLTHLQKSELYRYKMDLWHYRYNRLSINFFAFNSNDILKDPITGSDEAFLTVKLPLKLQRPVVLEGSGIAVHFGFQRQVGGHGNIKGSALNDTDLIHRYGMYAEEFICGKPWGSPMI
ncbi:hypothetical protein Slin15195_G081530 [Septoria linicola]|uniref:Uncharacterized protein n=1 Tax=Septoria linicola TaxID=215465 RepID=A0A9Q9AU53_9PEZI|nr:hypothetical protein Slin15195_G081530 [Septoria linicola]